MRNRKINLFQGPNCYADDCNNNTDRHFLNFFSWIILCWRNTRNRGSGYFSTAICWVFKIYSKHLGLIYLDETDKFTDSCRNPSKQAFFYVTTGHSSFLAQVSFLSLFYSCLARSVWNTLQPRGIPPYTVGCYWFYPSCSCTDSERHQIIPDKHECSTLACTLIKQSQWKTPLYFTVLWLRFTEPSVQRYSGA